MAVLALAALLISPTRNSVQAAPLGSVPAVSVTVPAGGTATLEIRGIALQPGSSVAAGAYGLSQQPLAADRLRTTLYYGIDWGYTETSPQQVALALWWAQDGNWLAQDRALAERIANAAAAAPGLPVWFADGRSIVSLVSQGQLSVAGMQLSASTSAPALGTGTLRVRNSTGQDILAHLPYGVVFTGQAGSALVWAVGAGTATPPSATAEPPAATETAVPVPTEPSNYKPGYTPTEEVPATATTVSEPAATHTSVVEPAPADETPSTADAPSEDPAGVKAPPADNTAGETAASAENPAQRQVQAGVDAVPPKPNFDQPSTGQAQAPAPVETSTGGLGTDAESAPQPLSTPTKDAGGATAPPPVQTVQTEQQPPPQPELTKEVPIDEATPTFTPAVKQEPTPPQAGDDSGAAGQPGQPGTDPTKAVPTEEPKLDIEATPVPTPETSGGPIINVLPDASASGGTESSSGGTGAPPNSAPGTGGGPSAVPAWLALFSAIMMLGGWSLRRIAGSAAVPVRVEARTEEAEEPGED